MSRVALVTGGTRGIGEAISIALKEQSYNVIASYTKDEQAAAAFFDRTQISTCKFDVSDFDNTQTAIENIKREHGPIEILINNAGITRDSTLKKMQAQQWQDVIQT